MEISRWLRALPCNQITKTFFTGAYAIGGDLDGETPDSGLISFGQMPRDLEDAISSCFPNTALPVAPYVKAIGYDILTGASPHTIRVEMVGRRVFVDVAAGLLVRGTIPIFDASASFFSAFAIPVPLDTESGADTPWSIRIITTGKTGRSTASVSYQWDLIRWAGGTA